jgi:hypothetical protein
MTFLCACVLCWSLTTDFAADFAPSPAQATGKPQPSAASPAPGQGASAAPSPLEEVIANLKREAVGPATLADLDMPDAFLARVAGRILRASYEENFRIVVPDEKPEDGKKEKAPSPGADGGASSRSSSGSDAASVPREHTRAPDASPTSGFDALPPLLAICAGIGLCGAAIFFGIRRARRGRADA